MKEYFAKQVTIHTDPVTSIILWVSIIFFAAIMGRYLAKRFKQPAVLGELLMGVFFGNLGFLFGFKLIYILREGSAIFNIMQDLLVGTSLPDAVKLNIPNVHYAKQVMLALSSSQGFDFIKIAYILDIFSRYGVIFLLFLIGLENSVSSLKQTGRESLQVAVIGVIAPILLGFIVVSLLLPYESYKTVLFIAATLSATSVGITARVISDLHQLASREAKTIIGAAVIDDILGLIILAIVSSVVIDGVIQLSVIIRIIISAILFFILALGVGPILLRRAIVLFKSLGLWEAKLVVSFLFLMILSWLAACMQLATIIGAFTAGLIIHDGFFSNTAFPGEKSVSIKNLVAPLEAILAPLFFILIGIQVKLESFANWHVLFIAAGLIVAAIVGKLLSGLGGAKKDDRLLIGIGMLPRGEVGLVFASIGRTLGVISDELLCAIILMIIVTTFIAPIFLKVRFAKASMRFPDATGFK